MEELLKIREENKRKLDELLSIPNYQEVLGRKWYGDRWRVTLYGNHPDREDWLKEIQMNSYRRQQGEDIPYSSNKSFAQQPIIQLDLDGNEIQRWNSSKVAVKGLGLAKTATQQITQCARGDAKTAYGYIWKFDKNKYENPI